MGLNKGDGIGVLSWNCIECAEIVGAAMKGGFIVSPLNPRLSTEELHYIINYWEVKTLFVGKELTVTIDQLRPGLPTVQYYISLEGRAPGMREYAELVLNSSKEEPDLQVQEDDLLSFFTRAGPRAYPEAQSTPIAVRWRIQGLRHSFSAPTLR